MNFYVLDHATYFYSFQQITYKYYFLQPLIQLLNPWNAPGSNTQVEITRMRSEIPDENDGVLTSVPDKKFYLGMDFNKVDNFNFHNPDFYPLSFVERSKHLYSPQMNRISSQRPPSPPLSQYDDVPQVTRMRKGRSSGV